VIEISPPRDYAVRHPQQPADLIREGSMAVHNSEV